MHILPNARAHGVEEHQGRSEYVIIKLRLGSNTTASNKPVRRGKSDRLYFFWKAAAGAAALLLWLAVAILSVQPFAEVVRDYARYDGDSKRD